MRCALLQDLPWPVAVARSPRRSNINKKPVKLVAGAPGYDHIQPFMAERMKLWEQLQG